MMPEMKPIVKIVVNGSSGYGPYVDAYTDKVTITAEGIQYQYKPMCPEVHRPRKWSYRTDRPEFRELWSDLCRLMPDILAAEEELVCDGSEITFIVTFNDKTKQVKTFWSPDGDPFFSCFRLIRKMIPGEEEIPAALWLPEDDEEGS